MKNRLSYLVGVMIAINIQTTGINAYAISTMTRTIVTSVGHALSKELVPTGIKLNWANLINPHNKRWVRLLSLYTLAQVIGLSYVPALCEFNIKDGLKIRGELQPLSHYNNSRFNNILAMARTMKLDPNKLYVAESDSPDIHRSTACATQTFTKNILLIDAKSESTSGKSCLELSDNERTFMIGHELAHIKYHHILKDIGIKVLAPWLIRAGLIIGNTLAQLGLTALAQKFNLQNNRALTAVKKIALFLFRNPFMEALYTNRFVTYYLRSQEKQADIESAKKFNCAADGVSLLQKIDALAEKKYSRARRLFIQFIDTHPTNAERIEYLQKIAAQPTGCTA